MKKNLVTIIAPLRDDNYHHDSLSKTQFTIQYALETIFSLNLQKNFSLTLVDWGSKSPISKKLHIPKKFQKNITCYYVNEKLAKRESDEEFRMHVHKCWNLAERLTNAEYCINAHVDQIYTRSFFVNIKQLIDGKYIEKNKLNNTIFWIPRKFADDDFFSKKPWPQKKTVDRYFENINFSSHNWKNTGFFIGGGPAGFLAKTQIFRNLRGSDEDYMSKSGMIVGDETFYQKGLIKYDLIDSSNFGIMSYRFANSELGTRFKYMLKRLGPIKFENPDKPDQKWGLKNKKCIITKFSNKKLFKVEDKFYLKLPKKKFLDRIKKIRKISKSEIIDNRSFFSFKKFYITYFILSFVENFRSYSYLEYGYRSKNTLAVIGSFFKGLNLLAADFTFAREGNNILDRLYDVSSFFYRRKKFHAFRNGNTKLASFYSIKQSHKIFSHLIEENFGNVITVSENMKVDNKLIKILSNKKRQISFIFVDGKVKKKEYLGKHFIKIYDDKYITLFMNFKIDKNKVLEKIKDITEGNLRIKFLILLILRKLV
jgi:hypothetical protein